MHGQARQERAAPSTLTKTVSLLVSYYLRRMDWAMACILLPPLYCVCLSMGCASLQTNPRLNWRTVHGQVLCGRTMRVLEPHAATRATHDHQTVPEQWCDCNFLE